MDCQQGYQNYDQVVDLAPAAVVADGAHFTGGSFSKTAPLVTTLTPTGPRGQFQGWVRDVGTGLWSLVAVPAPLTLDLNVVGAGGRDQGVLDADKVYLAYLIAQAGGANPALLGARDITAAPVMPPGYVGLSIPAAPIWTDNPATSIAEFDQGASGWFRLKNIFNLTAVTGFTGIVPTAVDFTDMVPADPDSNLVTIAADVFLTLMGLNGSATSRIMSLLHTSTESDLNVAGAYSVAEAAGNIGQVTYNVDVVGTYGRTMTAMLYVDWNGAVTSGGRVYLSGVRLRGWA